MSASRDLGVTHCTLQGMLRRNGSTPRAPAGCRAFDAFSLPYGYNMALHLFLKLVVQDGVAHVRGFAMVEAVGAHIVGYHFLSSSVYSAWWSHKLWLGSARTGHMYGPLMLFNSTGQYVKYIVPQPFLLQREDLRPELQVYSPDFGYTCALLPAKDSALGRAISQLPRPQPFPEGAANSDSSSGSNGSSSSSSRGSRGRNASSLGSETIRGGSSLNTEPIPELGGQRVLFLLAPFFDIQPAVVARLLSWSVRWHRRLGVAAFVLYVQWGLHAFVDVPEVQDMVRRRELFLVHWDAMAGLATPKLMGGERSSLCDVYCGYWHKFIIYNHFFVAMWLEDVLIFEGDFDEWIMTPKPMTISQILSECSEPMREPVANLELRRRVASCSKCGDKAVERDVWMAHNLTGAPEQHPLLMYQIGPTDLKPKSIFRPELTLAVDPHFGQPVSGAVTAQPRSDTATAAEAGDKAPPAGTGCAFVLHMAKLLVDREYRHDDVLAAHKYAAPSRELLWPLYVEET